MKFRGLLSSGFGCSLRSMHFNRPKAGGDGGQTGLSPQHCAYFDSILFNSHVSHYFTRTDYDGLHEPGRDSAMHHLKRTPEFPLPWARGMLPAGSSAGASATIRGSLHCQVQGSLGSAAPPNTQSTGLYCGTSMHTHAASSLDLQSSGNLVGSRKQRDELLGKHMHVAQQHTRAQGVRSSGWKKSSTPRPRSLQDRPWISLGAIYLACSHIQALAESEGGITKEQVAEVLHPWLNIIDEKLLTQVLSKQRNVIVAWLVFEWAEMQAGFKANVFHLTKLLQIASNAEDFSFADKIMVELHKRGLKPNSYTFSSLIAMYSRAGMVDRVVEIHKEMKDMSINPDVVVMSAFITAYGRALMISEMEEVYAEIDRSNLQPNHVTMSAMIDGYAKAGMTSEMDRYYWAMVEKGFDADQGTLNSMITVFAKMGKTMEMEKVYREMQKRGIQVDVITLNAMIGGYGKAANITEMEEIYRDMQRRGLEANLTTYNSMIDSYSKANKITEIERLYKEMQQKGVKANLVTFNAMIAGYGRCGMLAEMEKLSAEMLEGGLEPDCITFNAMVDAYANGGNNTEMERVLLRMKECAPDVVTLNTMIDGYGCAGLTGEMERVFGEMMKRSISPNRQTFTSLIKGYSKVGMMAKIEALLPIIQKAGFVDDLEIQRMLGRDLFTTVETSTPT